MDAITTVKMQVPQPRVSAPSSGGGSSSAAGLVSAASAGGLAAKGTVDLVAAQVAQQASAPLPQAKPDYFVVSNETFTIYKVGQQYITRYRDMETGQVTYIPKESLPHRAGGGSGALDVMA